MRKPGHKGKRHRDAEFREWDRERKRSPEYRKRENERYANDPEYRKRRSEVFREWARNPVNRPKIFAARQRETLRRIEKRIAEA